MPKTTDDSANCALSETLTPQLLQRLRRSLRRWYARHARDLPWRKTADAYRIWISEIMLQQTTVAAVVPYYQRFVERFPTVEILAAADEAEVLRHWEGLGYYSRARNIHKTSKQLVAEQSGKFPEQTELLQRLPGIGRYTAGAIASFAFGQRAPILEANTLRLYSRLLGYLDDPRSSTGQSLLWGFAERILPRKEPGLFNQALMELGATVCSPVEPNCPRCPLRTCCRAFADGTQSEIPLSASKPKTTHVTEAAVAVRRNGDLLLRKCSDSERWAGLWDFPRFPVSGQLSAAELTNTLEQSVLDQTGVSVEIDRQLTEIRHSVTRYRIRLLCFLAVHRSGKPRTAREIRWVPADEVDALPLSVTGRKLAKLLAEQ